MSRGVSSRRRRQARGAGRSLQSDESRQRADPQCELRARRLSDESVVHLQPDHCRRRPENVTVRAPADLLKIACHDATKPRPPRTAPRGCLATTSTASGPHRTVRSRCPRARMPIRPSAALGQFVAVTWSAATSSGVTDIYATTSRDGGRTFAAPMRVNRTPGDASVGGEQPPRVTLRAAHWRRAGDRHRLDDEGCGRHASRVGAIQRRWPFVPGCRACPGQ